MPLAQNAFPVLPMILAALLLVTVLLLLLCNFKRKKLSAAAFSDQLTGGLSERAFLARVGALLKDRNASFALVSMQAANLDQICVSFGAEEQPTALNRLHGALMA